MRAVTGRTKSMGPTLVWLLHINLLGGQSCLSSDEAMNGALTRQTRFHGKLPDGIMSTI